MPALLNFDQIDAALVSIWDFFQKHYKMITDLKRLFFQSKTAFLIYLPQDEFAWRGEYSATADNSTNVRAHRVPDDTGRDELQRKFNTQTGTLI